MVDWDQVRREYDRTVIDWTRLRAYSLRVAKELSGRDNAPSWRLEQRYWKRVDGNRSYTETMREITEYRLGRDGSLFVEHTTWSEMLNPTYWETEREKTRRNFTDQDVILFDFDSKYYLATDRKIETNRERSNKLLTHAKGVGLTKRLGALLRT